MVSEILEIFMFLAHNTIRLCVLEFKYFRRKLPQVEWGKTVLNLGMSRFISLTKLGSAAFFTSAPHHFTLNFEGQQLFHNRAKN